MSKTVLIVEKDVALMHSLKDAFVARGFEVQETTDGKNAPELIRSKKPDGVVLAVDLDAGQNGYIICKKLKSEDDLKHVPVIIIGDPKGFAQHQKLKTRADDYVGKPCTPPTVMEHLGKLIGFPPEPEGVTTGEENFDAGSLLDEGGAEDIAIDTGEETVGNSDPDFDMVDSMFDDAKPAAKPSPSKAPPANPFDEDGSADKTIVGFSPAKAGLKASSLKIETFKEAPPPAASPSTSKASLKPVTTAAPAVSRPTSSTAGNDAATRELKSQLVATTASLDESRSRIGELETKISELESQIESHATELETAKHSGGKSDKELFNLKDSLNKKDKENLRLKTELNAKEQEIVELRDKENALEQQASEASGELGRKDAQLKTITAKAEQLTTERKKIDQQLMQAKEEARTASAQLSSLQADYDSSQARIGELEAELEPARQAQADADAARQTAESELAEARGEIEALKSQLDERSREADELRGQHEQASMELDSARSQLNTLSSTHADELSNLRQKADELEAEARKHEERANKHQSRNRANQDAVDRARESLRAALEVLEQQQGGDSEEVVIDELAEA